MTAPTAHRVRGVLVLLGVWAIVYLPFLGTGGLSSTEGHRAIPGWAMLESGEWLLPRLFGQVYLRKPPGMPWAVAASSGLFGETEFAARLPSALSMVGMSLLAFGFATRWFGRGGEGRGAGLAAGLATLLTPWFWSCGRSAEIEALNNFGTCASVLLMLELLMNRRARAWPLTLAFAGVLGLAMLVAALAKGPAGFAAIGSGAVIGFVFVGTCANEPRAVARVRASLWLALSCVLPGAVLTVLYLRISRAVSVPGQFAVVQDVTEFMWGPGSRSLAGVGKVLLMPIAALAAGLPGSLGLLLPWNRAASTDETRLARTVAGAGLLSLLILLVLGVGNVRYAMPSLCFVPVLTGYAWRRARSEPLAGWRPGEQLARAKSVLYRGRLAAALLVAGAAIWIGLLEPRERARSGRAAGIELGGKLPDGSMIWADQMIEARPEVLWYARQEAARGGRRVEPVWVVGMARPDQLPLPRKGFLLLRTDPRLNEAAAYGGFMDRLRLVWTGHVHKYDCALYAKD